MNFLRWFVIVCFAFASEETFAQSGTERVHVEIQTLAPQISTPGKAAGIALTPVYVVFHNGNVDLFDMREVAPAPLAEFVGEGKSAGLDLAIAQVEGSPVGKEITNFGTAAYRRHLSTFPAPPFASMDVVPSQHKYFSFLARVHPSDDAFVGNDDPMRFQLFDDNGNFLGPVTIELYGVDVLDAGVKQNDELNLPSNCQSTNNEMVSETNVVRHHPGFNGSTERPAATPVNILGHKLCINGLGLRVSWRVGKQKGDFTRAGYPLLRIIITQGVSGKMSGAWFNSERAGAGFFIDVIDNENPRMHVNWLTYKSDGSGEQVWLAGVGPVDSGYHSFAEVELFLTQGPGFAIPVGAGDLTKIPWGTIRVQFEDCDKATVYYDSDIPGYGRGQFEIVRLSPDLLGLPSHCEPSISGARFVAPPER